jgi:hypothetical protein
MNDQPLLNAEVANSSTYAVPIHGMATITALFWSLE